MKSIISLILIFLCFNSNAGLRVASYNIRNFDYDTRSNTRTNKNHLVNTIKAMNADLMAIQEINEQEEFKSMISNKFKNRYKTTLSTCGGFSQQKLGFIYDKNKLQLMNFKEDVRTSKPGRTDVSHEVMCVTGSRPLAIATFKNKLTNEKIVVISVHLKAGGKDSSIKKRFKQHNIINDVVAKLARNGLNNVIILGDFNSTEYSLKRDSHQRFKASVKSLNAIDTTEQLQCSSYWWGGADDSKQYPSVLDHILISRNLLKGKTYSTEVFGHCKQLACKVTYESEMGTGFDEVSDHCPVLTEIK
ncbi:MAG: hypothetical protein HON90_03390 [Halobacteriovoraceae bacterium]|nr:hypothetical protein [Halobacteriovoraceae bacterium]